MLKNWTAKVGFLLGNTKEKIKDSFCPVLGFPAIQGSQKNDGNCLKMNFLPQTFWNGTAPGIFWVICDGCFIRQ
jgi:hypothetical protein